jgi:hypothetical protein
MNVERNTDRRLRAWVAEGIDRAPERFVWAAIDEVERMPQRRPWRTALDGLSARLRPVAGVLAGAGAVVAAVVVLLQVVGPIDRPGPAGRDFTLPDLDRIVLWEDTRPSTWRLDNLVSNPDEVLRIPVRSMTDGQLEALEHPPGYISGRYTDFTGQDAAYMSWGTVFESAADAAAAFPFFQNEMSSPAAWGLRPRPIELGDGGFVYEGETTAFVSPPTGVDPIPATVYLWRDGNALLAVGGWFNFDADELRTVAEGMDARAAAVSEERR